MIQLASFMFRKQMKGLAGQHTHRLLILLPLLALAALAIFQDKASTDIRSEQLPGIGLAAGALLCMLTLFGLLSNRLPSRMEDVVWVYTLPLSLEKVVWAVLLLQLFLRGIVWWGAALLADLLRWSMGLPYEAILARAIYGFLVLAVIEIWLVAASASRANLKLAATVGVLSFIGLLIIAAAFFLPMYGPEGLMAFSEYVRNSFAGFGFLLCGGMHPGALAVVILLMISAYMAIKLASKDLYLKEKIVKEADFWSNFTSLNGMVTSLRGKSPPSYWGGAALTGTWSFLWVEWVIVKKSMANLIGQFLFGAVLAAVVARWFPSWFGLIIGLVLISTVLGAYFSGLVRHAQTGDLMLFPGYWFKKALLLECFHLFPLFAAAAIYTVIGLFVIRAVSPLYLDFLYWIPALLILIGGLRLHVFSRVYRARTELPIAYYYRVLSGYGAASIIVVLLIVKWLELLALNLSYMVPAALVLLGLIHGWMSIRRFRQ